jgi:RND superfamily putative drug exporter
MRALTELAARHARLAAVIAVVLTAIAAPLASRQQNRLSAGDTIASSSQSATVSNAIASGRFAGAVEAPLFVVLQPTAAATPSDLTSSIQRAAGEVSQVSGVYASADGTHAALAQATQHPSFVVLRLHYGSGAGIDQARALLRTLQIGDPNPGAMAGGRIKVYLVGEGALWATLIQTAYNQTTAAEAHALPLTLFVLLLVFGSVAAALLPLAVGLISVALAGAIIYLLSFVTDVSIFASTVASMVGLGVAIDYSMFILVRYREEIEQGHDHDEARRRTMATSGRAIMYSGMTVAISLSGLFLIASGGVRSIGLGTIIVVGVSVVVALIMLPILIGVLGPRAYEPGRLGRLIAKRPWRRDRQGFWERWSDAVMRRPVVALVSATSLMLLIAAPALKLTVRNSAEDQIAHNNQVVVGALMIAKKWSPGVLAPIQALVSGTPAQIAGGAATRVAVYTGGAPTISSISRVAIAPDGRSALVTAQLKVDPESVYARETIDGMRQRLQPTLHGAKLSVGGATAEILDFDRLLSAQLWRPILFVLSMCFVVLLFLFRSIVLPIKAVLMNLLSMMAAYGALVIVFKWGWLGWAGIPKADTLYPITLPLILTLCMGLSMDYHIFMLSRIQERYLASGDTRTAVGQGLATSATAITSAAAIMVVVFLAFVFNGSPSVKQVGLAAAVAIALDATIVRLIIVPAAMELLGKWNWWMPARLGAVIGHVPRFEAEVTLPASVVAAE